MEFWNFVSKYWIVLIICLLTWIIGIFCGSKLSRIKTLFIKNPFKGKASLIRDESNSEVDALRYKRDYIINLVIQDDKEFPFKDVSDFTFRLEDIIKNEIDLKASQQIKALQYKPGEPVFSDVEKEGELVIMDDDLEQMCNPEEYYKS